LCDGAMDVDDEVGGACSPLSLPPPLSLVDQNLDMNYVPPSLRVRPQTAVVLFLDMDIATNGGPGGPPPCI
jgi:hypothetical protein